MWQLVEKKFYKLLSRSVRQRDSHTQLSALHIMPSQNLHKKRPIYGNFLRIKRNCTKSADFEKHSKDMKTHYSNRGYPAEIIEESYQKARNQDHNELIHGTKTKAEGAHRIPLILTYNPLNPNLMKIIKRHWPALTLHLSPECKKTIPRNTNSCIS